MATDTGRPERRESRRPEFSGGRADDLMNAEFQANPAYELTLYDRLPEAERDLLSELRKSPDFYGVLRPRGDSKLGFKTVNRETALLLLTLPEPSPLPGYVRAEASAARSIAQMVLDGVLAVSRGGPMVSGPAAFELVLGAAEPVEPPNALAALSRDALRYAQELPIAEAAVMAMRLYDYGRIARSPAWNRRYPDAESARKAWGLGAQGDLPPERAGRWRRCDTPPPNDGWLAWESRDSPPRRAGSPSYKLYVSPHPDYLRDAMEAVSQTGAAAFKAGKTLSGILRPDKLVAYFDDWKVLEEAAAAIEGRLRGCRPQGVPFSAQLGGSMLLSWGADPPEEAVRPRWMPRESWRLWIVNRLAVALLAAKRTGGCAVEPAEFAVARLRLDGIDTETWTRREAA
jgi:hypothetical protein